MHIFFNNLVQLSQYSFTMTSTSDEILPSVGTIERRDGNVTFRLPCIDGMGVIPFPEMMRVGVAERYQAIKNLELRKSDILLVSHPKSGIQIGKW